MMDEMLEVFLNLGTFSTESDHLEVAENTSSPGTFVILSGVRPLPLQLP